MGGAWVYPGGIWTLGYEGWRFLRAIRYFGRCWSHVRGLGKVSYRSCLGERSYLFALYR